MGRLVDLVTLVENTLIIPAQRTFVYFYYNYFRKWQEVFKCDQEGFPWDTAMDGIGGWSCTIWSACMDQVEVKYVFLFLFFS